MKVNILKLNKNAIIPFKTYSSDFCYDVVAVSEEEVAPNVWRYGLGIAMQIERGEEKVLKVNDAFIENYVKINMLKSPLNLSLDFRPRSSIWKTGMSLANKETATGDESYTGEYMLVFYHLMTDMPRYKVGDKIAQMKIGITFPIEFNEVTKLTNTKRGSNGFGSTGQSSN